MNDGVIRIAFSLVYVSLKEFGVVGSDTYTWGIKDFHKCWSGSLAMRRLPWARRCNKLHSTVCIVLLSEFVYQNVWLQHGYIAPPLPLFFVAMGIVMGCGKRISQNNLEAT